MVAAAMVVTLVAGCGSGSQESTGSSSQTTASTSGGSGTHSIQVIVKTLSNEYFQYVEAGAKAYNKDHPEISVEVVGPSSETAYDEQQIMIETGVTSGKFDGLVICPLQGSSCATQIANVSFPVVALDTVIPSDKAACFVGTGNEAAAKEGAESAVAKAKELGWSKVTAIEIAGVQGDSTSEARLAGYKEGTEEAGGTFLNDEIQYADAVADKAVTAMEAIMQNHPEGVSIIYTHNDDSAIAAARAASGNAAYANTIFCGFDGIQAACKSILDGGETMSVAQNPYKMGYQAVESCVAAINGESVKDIDTGCEIITKDNAQTRLDELQGYLK